MALKRVFKYGLTVTDVQNIWMPKGAKLLSVQMQHGKPQLWALVDRDETPETRSIITIGTGNPIEFKLGDFIGTYQAGGGGLVFHVFEGD